MNAGIYFIWFVGSLAIVCVLLYLIESLMDKHYRKKYTKNTSAKCPETGKRLKDFELMHGHCLSCKFHQVCKSKMVKAYNESRGV